MRTYRRRVVLPALFVAVAVFGVPVEVPAQELDLRLVDKTVRVDDWDLFYRIGGSGPPLLLIHGFALAGHDWDRFLDAFGQDYTVIVPDLRGHGRSSTNPATEFSYRDAAREMLALLDHAGFQKVQAIGFSAGACTLLRMATETPERLDAMVLVGGAHRLTTAARKAHLALPPYEDLSEYWKDYNRRFHPGGEAQVRSLLAQIRAFAHNYDDFDYSPEHLSTIPVRTLLVWGDRDEIFPMGVAEELYESLPAAALWAIPGQGHHAIWTDRGGSELAAKMFPTIALQFLAAKESK